MRSVSFICLFFLVIGCTGTKKAFMSSNQLNGTWVPVKQEFGGKAMPPAAYVNQQLVIKDSIYIFNAESEDKGIVQYMKGKMDIYGREGVNKGKHFTAIYKLENGELTICYDLSGKAYPESYDTKGKPMFFLSVYRKK